MRMNKAGTVFFRLDRYNYPLNGTYTVVARLDHPEKVLVQKKVVEIKGEGNSWAVKETNP